MIGFVLISPPSTTVCPVPYLAQRRGQQLPAHPEYVFGHPLALRSVPSHPLSPQFLRSGRGG